MFIYIYIYILVDNNSYLIRKSFFSLFRLHLIEQQDNKTHGC